MADAVPVDEAEDFYNDRALRKQMFERDEWRCRYCGIKVGEDTATLDHVVPRSKGGLNGEDNLASCCLMCNSIKSGRTYEEAAPAILERVALRRAER